MKQMKAKVLRYSETLLKVAPTVKFTPSIIVPLMKTHQFGAANGPTEPQLSMQRLDYEAFIDPLCELSFEDKLMS
jgi:hypothetical protein